MSQTKSIIDKLNLHKYESKLVLQLPEDVNELDDLEFDTSVERDQYDLVFIFIYSLEELLKYTRIMIDKQLVKDKGYVFFAYPKKNNTKYEQYIERDSILPAISSDEDGYVVGSNLKFSRMVSFNDVFTVVGLKSEPKKAKKGTSTPKSQCVDDYIEHVNDIKQYLQRNEQLLGFYEGLTPGYQKNWARYVYSAKQKETQEKRLLEMETILGEGYKSIDLYRRRNQT